MHRMVTMYMYTRPRQRDGQIYRRTAITTYRHDGNNATIRSNKRMKINEIITIVVHGYTWNKIM